MPDTEIYRVTTVIEVDQSQLNVGLARAEAAIKAFQSKVAKTMVLGGAGVGRGGGTGGGGGGGGGTRGARVPTGAEIADVIAAGTGLSGKAVTAAGRGARSIAAVMRADQARVRTAIAQERLNNVVWRNTVAETTRVSVASRASERHSVAMSRSKAAELRAADSAARAAEKHNIALDAARTKERKDEQSLVTGALRQRLMVNRLNGVRSGGGFGLSNLRQQATNRPTSILGGVLNPLATIGLAAQGIGMIGRAIGGVASAAAAPVKAASDLNETVNMAQVIMGRPQTAAAIAWAQGNTVNLGMSTNEAVKNAALYSSTFRHAGMGQTQASVKAMQAVQTVADLSSLFNRPTQQVAEDYMAALTGRFRPMRKYGIVINEEDVRQEAVRMGVASPGQILTQQQRSKATESVLSRQAKFAAGDRARTSSQLANEIRTITALWGNFNAVVGQSALTASANFLQAPIKAMDALVKNLTATTQDPAFQNLDLFGRAGLMWENLTKSFDTWWKGSGKADISSRAQQVGNAFGTALGDFISGLAGISTGKDENVWVSAGKTAGSSFFKGFKDGFDAGNVAKNVGNAFYQNMAPKAAGGNATIGSAIGAGVVGAATIATAVKAISWFSRFTGITKVGGAIAGMVGRRAVGAAAAEGVGEVGGGMILGGELLSGPAGWAIAIGSLLLPFAMSYIANNPSALSSLGHPHDLCDCIQNAMNSILPFLGGARGSQTSGKTTAAAVPGTVPTPTAPGVPAPLDESERQAVSPGTLAPVPQAALDAVSRARATIGSGTMKVGNALENVFFACERWVENLFGAAGSQPSGSSAWTRSQYYQSKGLLHKATSLADVPAGAIEYFNQYVNAAGAGHAGISSGGGKFISALDKVTELGPGDKGYDFWNKNLAGYVIPDYGTAAGQKPLSVPGGFGTGQGAGPDGMGGGDNGSGISITVAPGAVTLSLSVDSLDDAGIARIASALGPALAQELAIGVQASLSNMTTTP